MSEDLPAVPEAIPQPEPSGQSSRRVPANPDAPKLRPKTERRIAVADEKSAQAYDELEAATEKFKALKQQMDDGNVQVVLELGDTAVHILRKI
jgi:uncharacterized protein YaaN involved in tellurite resistance